MSGGIFIRPWWLRDVWRRVVPQDVRFAVTFKSRTLSNDATASYTSYSLAYAKLRVTDAAEVQDSGSMTDGFFTTSWLVWQSDLDSVSAPDPKVGDLIVQSDGTEWQVQKVRNTLIREVWDLGVVMRAT